MRCAAAQRLHCTVAARGLLQLWPLAAPRHARTHTGAPAAAGRRAGGSGGDAGGRGDLWQQLGGMADKYITGGSPRSSSSSSRGGSRGAAEPLAPPRGVHLLLAAVLAASLLAGSLGSAAPLALQRGWGCVWAGAADAFVAPSSQLLARNLFFGYLFGRTIDNAEGGGALWLTFCLAAAGGGLAACLALPRRAPLAGCGGTGAMAGLCAAALLFNRHKQWHWQRVFELAVLLPFVAQQLLAGHAGLAQWGVLQGQRLGPWLPLLGGVAGAALAAALLALVRLLQQALAAQRQQQAGTGDGEQRRTPLPPADEEPVVVLLSRAVAQLLKRL